VVGGWRRAISMSHDQAQNQPRLRPAASNCAKDRQPPAPSCASGQRLHRPVISRATLTSTLASHMRATDDCGRNESHLSSSLGYRLCTRIRYRLCLAGFVQKTSARNLVFRANRQGSRLSHQGLQSFACAADPDNDMSACAMPRNIVMVVPRPRRAPWGRD